MSPLCLPCPPSTLWELEYGYTRDGRRPRHKLDPWGVWENAAAALATYNTWSHLTKRKTHVYLGQNKTTFILNLLSLVVKLDKGQDSVFWFFFFKKMYNRQKERDSWQADGRVQSLNVALLQGPQSSFWIYVIGWPGSLRALWGPYYFWQFLSVTEYDVIGSFWFL